MSTLILTGQTSAREDAMRLHRAFKGFGCDTSVVIEILAHRDARQRAEIQREYYAMQKEDILKRLESELTGDLEMAVLLWMHDPATRDAMIIKTALGNDLKCATEVICSRTPSQIQTIKQIYVSKTGIQLEYDIERRTSGDHKKMAESDANALYRAGEKRFGTDEKTFIRIFSERSRAHLAEVANLYNKHGSSLQKAVKKETSGLFEFALLTILQCAQNPGKYFAKLLHRAMKGIGTDEKTLTRIIVTRTEIDMQYIKADYMKKYKKPLYDAVQSETSGNYRTFLLELLGRRV
ncbi:annexin D5-like isoform X2 [Pistacia vera]|uniref:annexin D5-like isoform X2 n=1 Tax=Pistacia vera TaxID=55513 RepID=UPI001262D46F|nr:annexin D5-like isoform X2 [Pistacia vera]XP_031281169.1 annexin D5-like isoform X2 [Pistacia vera]